MHKSIPIHQRYHKTTYTKQISDNQLLVKRSEHEMSIYRDILLEYTIEFMFNLRMDYCNSKWDKFNIETPSKI